MPKVNDGDVIKILNDAADKIVQKAKENASWSSTIPNAISSEPAVATSDGYEVAIKLDASKDGPAPQSAAFEFGSGIHATRGRKGKYVIEPTNGGQALAISTSRWNFTFPAKPGPKMIGYVDELRNEPGPGFIVKYVDHPGVSQKAFVTPAILETIDEVEQKINQAIGIILSAGDNIEVLK